MLFNSFQFLLVFLPLTWGAFFLFGHFDLRRSAILVLLLASAVFYGYWNWHYLFLLFGSVILNFCFGTVISHSKSRNENSRKTWLTLAITLNILVLAGYKFSGFLPLAISFFTITQIICLVDLYSGVSPLPNFINYSLFVTAFPHLVAGPIVRPGELLPRFSETAFFKIDAKNISLGLTIFFAGLFKKTLIADNLAPFANHAFQFAQSGQTPGLAESWLGVLAFTLQLYFDLSGYSDMAIGLGLLFNLRLPLNFLSPYQATNISDFWRRWHITLSRFLRIYIYTPLVLLGARKGRPRPYWNLFLTMLIAGVWHGTGWNYLVWGGLHGVYLATHYRWQHLARARLSPILGKVLTFLAVVFSWPFFRASDLPTAFRILKAMLGFGSKLGSVSFSHALFIFALLLSVWLVPPLAWWTDRAEFEIDQKLVEPAKWNALKWAPSPIWAFVVAVMSVISMLGLFTNERPFLYFQF